MANKKLNFTNHLYEYIESVSLQESEILGGLREKTASMPMSIMQIAPEQGQFMRLMVQLIGAQQGIEVGVFTGYSALSVAMGLPENGKLVALDISEEWTNIGKPFWEAAGVSEQIDLRIGPAKDHLEAMLAAGEAGKYDFAFIDADKENYDHYYELCLQLLRPNGLIMIDNVLWSGMVADPLQNDAETSALRALNAKLHKDERIELSLLPISDGITMIRKK